jgi:hypothetical protein
MTELQPTDKKAAYTGLVVTAILLFAMGFTIVTLTNRHFAAKAHAEAGQQR